jgi:flagellar biosynthesis/type III secretory pathway protein FliH
MLYLAHSDGHSLLGSDSPIIKRSQRADFTDAASLLQAASAIRDRAETDTAAARSRGHAEGLAEAKATARTMVAEELTAFAAAVDGYARARRDDVAEAAYAAVRAIIGEIDDKDLVGRLVDRTLARLPGNGPIAVTVAPEMLDLLAGRLTSDQVTVIADPTLGATGCHVRTSDGQVIASLSIQLDALAKRWGVAT